MEERGEAVSIPAAARAAEVPERSLYRAVDAGEVPSRPEGGVKKVVLDDVLAWREARTVVRPPAASPVAPPVAAAPEVPAAALPSPAAAGGNVAAAAGGRAHGNGVALTPDGPTCARIFDLLEAGVSGVDIVRREGLSPELVEAASQRRERLAVVAPAKVAPTEPIRDAIRDLAETTAATRKLAGDSSALADSALQIASELQGRLRITKDETGLRLGTLEERLATLELFVQLLLIR